MANPPSVVVAEFDPFADPPRLPAPNDRLRDRRTGLLVVADEPTSGSDPSMARPPSPALLEYNQYLRTLDGYPAETPVRASFSAALDPRTVAPATLVKEGSVAVVDLREERVLSPVEYELQLADGGKTLRVLPRLADTQGRPSTKPWRLGHGYLVIVIGGADPVGLRTSDGKPVLASRATWFTRSRSPLLSLCAEGSPDRSTDRCLCPCADDALDPACSPATGLTLDEAQRLEPERRRIAGLLTRWVPLVGMGRARDNVVLAWTFTIAHGPFAVFDPRGLPGGVRVPFPNDTLLDANGHVMLAPPDGAPDALKALYASLGGLDGFSTTGDALVEVEVADDAPGPPLGVVAGKSARLVNLTTPSAAPTIDAAAEVIHGGLDYAGRIAIRPRRALLPDGVHYAAALTSAITDSRRRPLRPSPATRLLLMNAPLFADGRSTLPALLADADAQALEAVRLSYAGQGLWDATANPLGTRREEVAVLWTFRTLSVTKALVDVAALPSQRSLPTDVTIASVEPADSRWGAHLDRAVIGAMHSRLALSPSGALDLAGGRDVDVPFLLLTPKRVAATEMNVVIVQHGFGGWRGDVRAIADAFAALGYATVGIDTYLHGARARCSVDSDCRGGSCGAGGLCSTSLQVKCDDDRQCAAGGTCDGRSGQCSTGLAAESSLCLGWHDARGVAVSECKPTVSGAGFLNLGNPLATAGSLRQQVLDLAQLTRVLRSDDAAGLRAQLARSGVLLDGGRVAYFGQSLGAVEGAEERGDAGRHGGERIDV